MIILRIMCNHEDRTAELEVGRINDYGAYHFSKYNLDKKKKQDSIMRILNNKDRIIYTKVEGSYTKGWCEHHPQRLVVGVSEITADKKMELFA